MLATGRHSDFMNEFDVDKSKGALLHHGSRVAWFESANRGARFKHPPIVLVMHYTGGRNIASASTWLCSPKAKASAHIIVGKDGDVRQLVRLDTVAWHAGKSQYGKLTHCNNFSVGIELDNPGMLQRRQAGWYTTWGERVDDDLVVLDDSGKRGYHAYPTVQLEVALEVAHAIVSAYPKIVDVVGHEDVAPGRKFDPGPAFPMRQFHTQLFGRA